MNKIYQVYLISDSTGETLERIFEAIKAQFPNFESKSMHYSFTRTENQIDKILDKGTDEKNLIILYTIVDNNLANYLKSNSKNKNFPCFEVLGDLISGFSKLLKQEATHKPSGQHVLDEDYYKRIDAIQFTMSHDDGKIISDLEKSDIILIGASRTSKTPTSIYLANRGYRTSNIPVIPNRNIPEELVNCSDKTCVIGLTCDPSRLLDVRKNRIQSLHEDRPGEYTNEKYVTNELQKAKKIFQKYNWPVIDVTRKSVEETAASIIKIFDIIKSK